MNFIETKSKQVDPRVHHSPKKKDPPLIINYKTQYQNTISKHDKTLLIRRRRRRRLRRLPPPSMI